MIPERTLVWSARRDNPAPKGSTVKVTRDGLLAVTYSDGEVYNIYQGTPASSGLMQDNGNFVLRGDSDSQVLWQSFDSPTDTLLPGQIIVRGRKLYSNANGTVDYSTGRFMLEMQFDGNLVLSTYRFQILVTGYLFSVTSIDNVSMVFNQSAFMYLVMNSSHIIKNLSTNVPMPVEDYYHRATLDDYGNFQQCAYRKGNGSQWTKVWSAITEPCTVNGICGLYGVCTSPDNQRVNCSCLPGTSPLDPSNPSKGCFEEVVPYQFCGKNPSVMNFTVEVINDADFPNGYRYDLGKFTPATLESCTKAVMDDCYCTAATFENLTCTKKWMPLMNARKSNPSTNGRRALIKVATRTTRVDTGDGDRKNSDSRVLT